MSDELRDRIAGPIWQNSSLTPEGAAHIAQTIIDDLGLTVERVIRTLPPEHLQDASMDDPEVQEWASQQPTLNRVVGSWDS